MAERQAAPSPLLTEAQAQELCQEVLGRTAADGAEVEVRSVVEGNARFAVNRLTTAADVQDVSVTVSVRSGRGRAAVTFNTLEGREIGAAVTRAEQLARIAPEDPELMPLLPPQEYEPSPAFFEDTADLPAEARAEAVRAIVDRAVAAGTEASGFLQHRAQARAIANTEGLFAYHRGTEAALTTTVRTTDGRGSGWAGAAHNDWGRFPAPEDLAERAVEKARASVDPSPVEPGAYTVVLEPAAVGSLVRLLAGALEARAAHEGRSFFSRPGGGTRVGERLFDSRVTLLSDPRDPDLLEPPFTEEGYPVPRTVWIEDGTLRALAASRYWAAQQGMDPLPLAGGFKLRGGEGGVDDLVAGVERGLLVTRFWYIRGVDRRTLLYTGLTRDGTFSIRDGRVAGAVHNLRFNESPAAVLANLEAAGAPQRVVASESGGLGPALVVPPLVVRDFRFTAVSEAV